jgi:hypothetical protein
MIRFAIPDIQEKSPYSGCADIITGCREEATRVTSSRQMGNGVLSAGIRA